MGQQQPVILRDSRFLPKTIRRLIAIQRRFLCYQFANSKLNPNERFEKVKTKISKNNIKIISESCSFIECKITEIFDGGDHFIYLGLCVDGKINDKEKKPLIYHKGKLL